MGFHQQGRLDAGRDAAAEGLFAVSGIEKYLHRRTFGPDVLGDFGTAKLVAELVGGDLGQLRLVVDQLSLYVGAGAPIRDEDVEACLAATRAHSVFELVDAVGDKQLVGALKHLSAMMAHREKPWAKRRLTGLPRPGARWSARGFTLIELLVVIAILSIRCPITQIGPR